MLGRLIRFGVIITYMTWWIPNFEKSPTNPKYNNINIYMYLYTISRSLLSRPVNYYPPVFSTYTYTRCLATWNSFLASRTTGARGVGDSDNRRLGKRNPLKSFSRLITHGEAAGDKKGIFPFVLLRPTSCHKISPTTRTFCVSALKIGTTHYSLFLFSFRRKIIGYGNVDPQCKVNRFLTMIHTWICVQVIL